MTAQFVVYSERLWQAVYHRCDRPRYAPIDSFESGNAMHQWIDSQLPVGVPLSV